METTKLVSRYGDYNAAMWSSSNTILAVSETRACCGELNCCTRIVPTCGLLSSWPCDGSVLSSQKKETALQESRTQFDTEYNGQEI